MIASFIVYFSDVNVSLRNKEEIRLVFKSFSV